MEILTFPVGLLIGLFPVFVDMEGQVGKATLKLDGVPVCQVSVSAPACIVDLGPAPRIHTLDLERLSEDGKTVENVRRWVNRPASEAKVRAVGGCDEKRRECSFEIQWAHRASVDPSSLSVRLDGTTILRRVAGSVRAPFPGPSSPQVLAVEAGFPDGSRSTFTKLLRGSYPQEVGATIQPVTVELDEGESAANLEDRLRAAGWKVRAAEQGDAEILFVVEPGAFAHHTDLSRTPLGTGLRLSPFDESWPIATLTADESLSIVRAYTPRLGWAAKSTTTGSPGGGLEVGRALRLPAGAIGLPAALVAASARSRSVRTRIADAVAAAGYQLGNVSRRRIVVLVLRGSREGKDHPDQSTFSPAQAREYLGQAQVPLIVWRIGDGSTPEWPDAEPIQSPRDFVRAIARVKQRVDRQQVVWVEGPVNPATFDPSLPRGVTIAGRSRSAQVEVPVGGLPRESGSGVPVPFRDVYGLATASATAVPLFVATSAGLFVGTDVAITWRRIPLESSGIVFSVAVCGKSRTEIVAGGSGSLLHGFVDGKDWTSLEFPAVQALAVDPSDPSVVFGSIRGRIYKSTDGGSTWTISSNGTVNSFSMSLAVDPAEHSTVYAGTVGSGVLRSTDAGKSWKSTGRELLFTAVRCLVVDGVQRQVVYAGTDAGIFISRDAGEHWKPLPGPRQVVYALAVDSRRPALELAGTASGLFASHDGGASWERAGGPAGSALITSLALEGERVFLGTIGHGLLSEPVTSSP